jgi:hypothetical protein
MKNDKKTKFGCGNSLLLVFGIFSFTIIFCVIGSFILDGIKYEFAVECSSSKPEITNCYKFADATVIEIKNIRGASRTPDMEMSVKTDDGEKLKGKWYSKEIGQPFIENDSLKIEIWNESVIAVSKDSKTYILSDNPKLSFSKTSFTDIIIISVIVFVIVASIIIVIILNTVNRSRKM